MTAWREYDSAAEYMARRGLAGDIGDSLPLLLSSECHSLINADVDSFKERVRSFAYALAMESHTL